MKNRCEHCLDTINQKDDVVVVERVFKIYVYHSRCYEPNNFDYTLNNKSSTIITIFEVLLCLFIGIRAPELWLKILAVLTGIKLIGYRVYAYIRYER